MEDSRVVGLCARYSTLLAIAIINFLLGTSGIFYTIFTPLTIKPVFFILNYMYGAIMVESDVIFFKGYFANIIPACIAGAAYFFLLILNMTTPMPMKKRIKSMLFLWISFLLLNILRIVLFSILVFRGYKYFDFAHIGTWYFGSTIMIVLLWFVNIKIFNIVNVPAYTDVSYLFGLSRRKGR